MGRLTQWDYDIAMMKLKGSPVQFNSDISPICLPPVNFAKIGSQGFVTVLYLAYLTYNKYTLKNDYFKKLGLG